MASTEKATQKAILELCQRPHIRLWRTNSGSPKVGFRGAPQGTSDIIGWKSIGGCRAGYALFVALEVKDEKWKPPPIPKLKASKSTWAKYNTFFAQATFLDAVECAGGLSGFVRSVEDAFAILGL